MNKVKDSIFLTNKPDCIAVYFSATSAAISCFTCSEMAFPSIRVIFSEYLLVMDKSKINN